MGLVGREINRRHEGGATREQGKEGLQRPGTRQAQSKSKSKMFRSKKRRKPRGKR